MQLSGGIDVEVVVKVVGEGLEIVVGEMGAYDVDLVYVPPLPLRQGGGTRRVHRASPKVRGDTRRVEAARRP